jgi:hypothetical protein
MVQVEYLPLVLTGIGLIASILYYTMVLRNQNRTRQAQLFMQVYNQYTMEKYKQWHEVSRWEWDDFDDFSDKYGDLENSQKWAAINGWLEGLGVLVKSDLVPIGLVALFITGLIKQYWDTFGPIILEYRRRHNAPRGGSETEYLYDTLMAYMEEHPELKAWS